MKIRNVSCEQFAGLRLEDPVSFTDGINVVYGKNESGKSTLVNLIESLLFRKIDLVRNEKKNFEKQFFPVSRVGTTAVANRVEGKMTLEADEGRYRLSKRWGLRADCSLRMPDDLEIADTAGIEAELTKVLRYGEGVYSELLLSSQKNTDSCLRRLLDASEKMDAKSELINAVTRTFAESDGVSLEKIEERIEKKIEALASNWDIGLDAPRRKSTPGRHGNLIGEVLKAFYALEDAEGRREELSRLIRQADTAAEDCLEKAGAERAAGEALERYKQSAASLQRRNEINNNAQMVSRDLEKRNQAKEDWPKLESKLAKAKKLEEERKDRETADLYAGAKEIAREIRELESVSAGKTCPRQEEIRRVTDAVERIRKLENSLCAMNIRALARMQGDYRLEVVSLRTGEAIDLAEPITEAVRMIIPGVMEMELAPADLDVETVRKQIAEEKAAASEILNRYGAADADALKKLAEELTQAERNTENLKLRLSTLLNGKTYDEVEAAAGAVGEKAPRTMEEIRGEILEVCGAGSAEGFIRETQYRLSAYEQDYKTPEELAGSIRSGEETLRKFRDELNCLDEIPEEYQRIGDPQAYLERLKNALNSAHADHEDAINTKQRTALERDIYQEQNGDPAEDVRQYERELAEKKEKLRHWLHIREKFREQKDLIEEHPLVDLAKRFSEYLGVISGGRVTSDLPDADRLDLSILSGQRPLEYDLLSEGTKDTVSLAFRLAVVDHLFPEGGGVIVLDDPLTDMDEDRVEQSCELIRECAKRHQVIFLTCREGYQDKLQGNLIRI